VIGNPLALAADPRKSSANNCGHPTDLSGNFQGVNPLRSAGLSLVTLGIGSEAADIVPFIDGQIGKNNEIG
jgi:hypothetical protein